MKRPGGHCHEVSGPEDQSRAIRPTADTISFRVCGHDTASQGILTITTLCRIRKICTGRKDVRGSRFGIVAGFRGKRRAQERARQIIAWRVS